MAIDADGFSDISDNDLEKKFKGAKNGYAAIAGMQWDKFKTASFKQWDNFKSSSVYEPTKYIGGQFAVGAGATALGAALWNKDKNGNTDWIGAAASGTIGVGLFEINEFRKGTQFNLVGDLADNLGEGYRKSLKQSIFTNANKTAAIAGISTGLIGAVKGEVS